MTTLTRRSLLAAGTAALAAPLFARRALASSGEVNVFAWGDYFQPNIVEAFESATGIKVNVSTYGSNEEAASKLRAAGGTGFDVIFPVGRYAPELRRGRSSGGNRRDAAQRGSDPAGAVAQFADAGRGPARQALPDPVLMGHRGHYL